MIECYLRLYPEDESDEPRSNWELIGFKVEELPGKGNIVVLEGFLYEVVNVWWEVRDTFTLDPYIHITKLGPDDDLKKE